MSLIVFFSTDDGIVVVGDRASTRTRAALGEVVNLALGAVAGASKVFAYDNNTVFGVTGIPTMAYAMKDGTRQIAFSAQNLIMQFGRTNAYSPDAVEFWNELRELLLQELKTKAPPGPFWKPLRMASCFRPCLRTSRGTAPHGRIDAFGCMHILRDQGSSSSSISFLTQCRACVSSGTIESSLSSPAASIRALTTCGRNA